MIHHSTPKPVKEKKSNSLLYSSLKKEENVENSEKNCSTSFDDRAEEVFSRCNDPVEIDDDPDFDGSISSNSGSSKSESDDEKVVDLNESLKSCRKIGKVLARNKSLDLSVIEEKSDEDFDVSQIKDDNPSTARKLFDPASPCSCAASGLHKEESTSDAQKLLDFVEFSSADGDAFIRAKIIFDDKASTEENILPGLTTGCGKPVSISDQFNPSVDIHQNSALPGLSTAAGKPENSGVTTVVGKPVIIMRRTFEEMDEIVRADQPGWVIVNGRAELISKEKWDEIKRHYDKSSVKTPIEQNSTLPGSSTAAGKPVVLDQNIEQTKNMYADTPGLTTASGRPVQISEQNLAKVKHLFEDSSIEMPLQRNSALPELSTAAGKPAKNALPALTTASGRPVQISEQNLAKVKHLFEDSSIEMPMHRNSAPPALSAVVGKPAKNALPGLTTASGRPVQISEQNLAKVKHLFEDSSIEMSMQRNSALPELSAAAGKPAKNALPGLTTASGRPVQISEQNLAKVKHLFEDSSIEMPMQRNSALPGLSTAAGKPVAASEKSLKQAKKLLHADETIPSAEKKVKLSGFSTASGNSVDVSERSLAQAKINYDLNFTESGSFANDQSTADFSRNSESLIETFLKQDDTFEEILNDVDLDTPKSKPRQSFNLFDDTQESEKSLDQNSKRKSDADFNVSAKKIKRSSEDEMLMKSAKLKQKEIIMNKYKNFILQTIKKTTRLLEYGENLQNFTEEELINFGVDDSTMNVTSSNAANFKFILKKSGFEIEIDDILLVPDFNIIGPEEIRDAFFTCPAVDPSLLPENWVENHYRWIVWKLSSYETKFPQYFAQKCLTPKNILDQLKYRYFREIQCKEKPCLKKILDGNEPSQKLFICCVSSLKNVFEKENASFEITDGWYAMEALIDPEMVKLVQDGKVKVGTKLILGGTERVGDKLKIHTNSARRAKWYAKMGFSNLPPLMIGIESILPQGGLVSMTTAVVVRVYPMLHMSKDNEGKTVFRNDQMQFLEDVKNEKIRVERAQDIYEKILLKVEKEFVPQINFKDINLNFVKEIEDPEILYVILKETDDTSILTEEQINLAKSYHIEIKQKICREAEIRVNKEINSSVPKKKVTILKKFRLVDFFMGHSYVLTMWNSNEASELKEGKVYYFSNITACGIRDKVIQLSSTKKTEISFNPRLRMCDPKYPRKLTKLEDFSDADFEPLYGEVDICGVVVYVWKSEQPFGVTKVFLSDLSSNYLTIAFWSSLDKFGCKEILEEGNLVFGSNLQWRTGSRSGAIPCVYATESSIFSLNPKREHFRKSQIYKDYDKKVNFEMVSQQKVNLLDLIKDDGLKSEMKSTPCHKRIQALSELSPSPLPPVSPGSLVNKHPGVKKGFISPFKPKD